MHSLTNLSLKTIVKKQLKWKIKLYISALSSLIILQSIFGFLFFSSGSGSSGYGQQNLDLNFTFYSLDMHLFLSVCWAFISAIIFTTKAYRMDDLSVISSRTSSAIANMIVVMIYSLIAVFIMASTFYLQLLAMLFVKNEPFIIDNFFISPTLFIMSFSIICLFGAIGLLFGNCYKGPVFIKILTSFFVMFAVFILIISPASINLAGFLKLPNYMMSVCYLSMAALCFSLAIWIANKSEVSRT